MSGDPITAAELLARGMDAHLADLLASAIGLTLPAHCVAAFTADEMAALGYGVDRSHYQTV